MRERLVLTVAIALLVALIAPGAPPAVAPVAQAHVTATHSCGGTEAVVNGTFEADPTTATSGVTPPSGWVASGWTLGLPQQSGNWAAEDSPIDANGVSASDFLRQDFMTPFQAACFVYHAWSITEGTTYQVTVTYTTGTPSVSTFVHPGDNSYKDVSPTFDPSRFITSIEFRIVAGFSNCIDNVSIAKKEKPTKCPRTQGFWKTHPTAWPTPSLTLGTQSYSQAQLLSLLSAPSQGDASVILAKQLIAAKLNIANGSDPTPVASTIAAADSLLGTFMGMLPYNVKPSSATGQQMLQLKDTLDSYNNGNLTPNCTP